MPAIAVVVVPLQPVFGTIVHVSEVEEQVVHAGIEGEARIQSVDGHVPIVIGREQVEWRVAWLLWVEVEASHLVIATRVLGHRPQVGVDGHVAEELIDREIEV